MSGSGAIGKLVLIELRSPAQDVGGLAALWSAPVTSRTGLSLPATIASSFVRAFKSTAACRARMGIGRARSFIESCAEPERPTRVADKRSAARGAMMPAIWPDTVLFILRALVDYKIWRTAMEIGRANV